MNEVTAEVEDLYPSRSETFSPFPRKDPNKEEQKPTGRKYVKGAIEVLEAEINDLSSIDSITADLTREPEVHQREVAVNKLAKAKLTRIKEALESVIDDVR